MTLVVPNLPRPDYAKSIEDGMEERKVKLADRQANFMAEIQAQKNAEAPVIAGGGGSAGNANLVGDTSLAGGGNAQLYSTLKKAGFSGKGLQTAYAVAMAESGGRSTAHNPNASTGDNSYGLFQINMLGAMGPARRKQYGLSSNNDLFNPLTNAKVAYKLSKGGTNWSPWSTYKNGAYKKYMGSINFSALSAVGGKTVPVAASLTQSYGKRNSRYVSGYHTGYDYGASYGSTVKAAANGTVIAVGNEGAYGKTIRVRHSDGTTTLYGHLSGYGVQVGQVVKAGQSIAKSGNTGRSTGPHLHFEVRSRSGSDVNPGSWLGR